MDERVREIAEFKGFSDFHRFRANEGNWLDVKILHVAPIGEAWHEGLNYSIPALVRAQARAGADVVLVTTRRDSRYSVQEDFPVYYYRDISFNSLLSLGRNVDEGGFDVVIFHSTYVFFQARIARIAKTRGIPYILTPRGGMTVGAIRSKRWKKKLGNVLFFSRMVRESVALHFLTQAESGESGFWDRPSFVVGNGIVLPKVEPEELERRGAGRILNLVFIGRLDLNHKGLDLLLKALNRCQERKWAPGVRVRIFGPGVKSRSRDIQKKIARGNLQSWVYLAGPVFGEKKERILRETDVFVLTSRFEGHPMSVLEALSYGIPCLLTPGTNMADEVADSGAGWKVKGDAESIAQGITAVVRARTVLPVMAQKARRLAEEHSWDLVGRRTLEEYQRVLRIQR